MATPYRVLGFTLLPLLRSRITRVDGLEHLPAGGCILVANHQSWIDSAILAGAVYQHIPKSLRIVAQSSKWRFLGAIPINEYDKSQVLDIATGYLQVGHPIMIFPEGNSNKDPELRTGKTGAARLALRSGAPVVPVGLIGTRGVKSWNAVIWFFSWWKPCRVMIGQPITYPQNVNPDHEQLMGVTQDIMKQISQVSGKPYSGEPAPYHESVSWMQKFVRRILLPIWRFRIRVKGAEHLPTTGPFIVAGNHQSFVDPPALAIAVIKAVDRQPFFLAKAGVVKLFEQLIGRAGVRALGMLMVDDRDRSKILYAAEAHLRRGDVIGIFPEGTRNSAKKNPNWRTELLHGKTGTARLVLATGAPVIPAGLRILDGHGIWHAFKTLVKFWQPIEVTFGPAIQFQNPPSNLEVASKEQLDEMMTAIMKGIGAVSGKTYRG